MRILTWLRIAIFLQCICVGLLSVPAAAQPTPDCPRANVLKNLKQTVVDAKALVEPVHVKNGLVIVVVANTEPGVAMLHRVAAEYEGARTRSLATQATRECDPLWSAVAKRQVEETIERFSRGFIVVYSTSHRKMLEYLHNSECCNFCTCPAGTVTQCARCC